MGLVTKVGRRRPRARLAMALLYLVLSIGAVTTVYPFTLMIATGFKGTTDQNDNKLVPAFWSDGDALFAKYLDDKYSGDLSAIESTRIGASASPESVNAYKTFLTNLPNSMWMAGFRTPGNNVTSRLSTEYQAWLRRRFANIDELNRAYIEENVAFQTVTPPTELLERRIWKPLMGKKREDWELFKRELPIEFRIPVREQRIWQEFLRYKFQNTFDIVPKELKAAATRFEQIPLTRSGELYREFRKVWIEGRFPNGTVEEMWGKQHTDPLPIVSFERSYVSSNSGMLRSEFSTRNYRYVLDYILINGRALLNTVIFCLLAILTQLIVNPLAAYALSRVVVPATGKILLFLLATMAFPAEVAMIPSFLLLKDLGLLNTFAALVLPSAASGYMIFLLKGFFDSLPQELYEAGQLDGAKESTMMWKIALPLSKPVLGYLALLAFMGAYGAFLYAFLVAQDQKMWTLMVWIYQLQSVAPKAVIMAALTLAAVPTLIVFLMAQGVIMRGIVLPGER